MAHASVLITGASGYIGGRLLRRFEEGGRSVRHYLWILARKPQLNDEAIAAARVAARDNGFDIGRLVPTRQSGITQ